ncbi:MAG: type II secretion system protein GspN, partial [Desulfobacterales bacterium]|nr:type II secretion system protein GspN [Desulfobacterales bacterium]
TRISWAIYIICAALFFFYYLFPSDTVKEYLADQIQKTHPNLTVKISRVRPAFPPGLKLYRVSVYHLDQTLAGLDDLKISLDILSLFLATTHLRFEGNGYGGILKGRVDIIKKSPGREVMIDADLSGIQVNQIEALSAVTTHKISGNLEGRLTFKSNEPNQALTGDLTLINGQVEFSPPVLSQNVITFDTIEAEVELNDRSLMINRCQLEGSQLDADVAGSIKLSGRSVRKLLDLSGTVKPHEALLAKLGDNIPELIKGSKLENQGIPFRIKGPMDSPQYSFY